MQDEVVFDMPQEGNHAAGMESTFKSLKECSHGRKPMVRWTRTFTFHRTWSQQGLGSSLGTFREWTLLQRLFCHLAPPTATSRVHPQSQEVIGKLEKRRKQLFFAYANPP